PDLAGAGADDPAAVALARTRLAKGFPAGQQRGQRPIGPDDEDIEDTVIGADTSNLDPGRHAAEVRDQHLRRVRLRPDPIDGDRVWTIADVAGLADRARDVRDLAPAPLLGRVGALH